GAAKRGAAGEAKRGAAGGAKRRTAGAVNRGAAKRGAAGAAKRGATGALKRGAAGAARMPPKPPGLPCAAIAVPAKANAAMLAMRMLDCHTARLHSPARSQCLCIFFAHSRASLDPWETPAGSEDPLWAARVTVLRMSGGF